MVEQSSTAEPDYTMAAEALVLVSGVFPEALTAAQGREARDLPGAWYRQLRDFLRQENPVRWRMVPQPSPERTYARLREPIPDDLTAGMTDPGLVSSYMSKLEECRRYLQDMWPVLHVETLTGAEFIQPSLTGLGEAWSILAMYGSRDRLMHELASGALTAEQALAFRTLCPGLYEMVRTYLRFEVGRMQRAKEKASWFVETTLRVLLDMDAGMTLVSPADEPPLPEAPPEMPSLDIDFQGYQTRAQAIDAR